MSSFSKKFSRKMFKKRRSQRKGKSFRGKPDRSMDLLDLNEFLKEPCDTYAFSNNDNCHKSQHKKLRVEKLNVRKTLCPSQLATAWTQRIQDLRCKFNTKAKPLFELHEEIITHTKFNSPLVVDVDLDCTTDFGESHPLNSTFAEALDSSSNLPHSFNLSDYIIEKPTSKPLARADLQRMVNMNSKPLVFPLNNSFDSYMMSLNSQINPFDSCVRPLNMSIDSAAPQFQMHRPTYGRSNAVLNFSMQPIHENSGEILEKDLAYLSDIINESIKNAKQFLEEYEENCQTINASNSDFQDIHSISDIFASSHGNSTNGKQIDDDGEQDKLDESSPMSQTNNSIQEWKQIYEDVNALLGIESITKYSSVNMCHKSSHLPQNDDAQQTPSDESPSKFQSINKSTNDLVFETMRDISTNFDTSTTQLNAPNTLAACPVRDQLDESNTNGDPFLQLKIPGTLTSSSAPVLPRLEISCTASEDKVTVHVHEATLAHCCSSYILMCIQGDPSTTCLTDIMPPSLVPDYNERFTFRLLAEDIEKGWLQIQVVNADNDDDVVMGSLKFSIKNMVQMGKVKGEFEMEAMQHTAL